MSDLLGRISECVRHRGLEPDSLLTLAAAGAHRGNADQSRQHMASRTIDRANECVLSGRGGRSCYRSLEARGRLGKRCPLGRLVDAGWFAVECAELRQRQANLE